MQQATLQAVVRVISQQLKGNVEKVDDNEVVGLVGPANETEIILNGRKVNSLFDSGLQVTGCSYTQNHNRYNQEPSLCVFYSKWSLMGQRALAQDPSLDQRC